MNFLISLSGSNACSDKLNGEECHYIVKCRGFCIDDQHRFCMALEYMNLQSVVSYVQSLTDPKNSKKNKKKICNKRRHHQNQ